MTEGRIRQVDIFNFDNIFMKSELQKITFSTRFNVTTVSRLFVYESKR